MSLKNIINRTASLDKKQTITLPNGESLTEWLARNADFVAETNADYIYLLSAFNATTNETIEKQYNTLKSLVLFLDETESICESKGESFSFWFNNVLTDGLSLETIRAKLLDLEKSYLDLGMPEEYKTPMSCKEENKNGCSQRSQDDTNDELDKLVYEIAKAPELYENKPEDTGSENLIKLMKKATPSKRGLYPHELGMLSACAKYKTRNNVFSRHWNYEYGIENPQYILDMLCEKGFIEPDDVFATINNFKASELKQELSALNLKVSGKKADLVDRLINAMDKASLDTRYPDRYYRLTSLGKLELEENNYLKYTTYGLDKWELNRLIAKGKHSCQEIVWNYLMKECNYYAKRYEMGMYRNSKCTVYRFLMQEQRTQEAFNTLAEIVYYDLSMSSNGDKKYYQEGAFSWILPSLTYITPYERSLYRSGMITEFTKLQQIMMLSDEDLKAKLKTAFEQFNIPAVLVLFTVDECAEIVIASLHKDTSYLNTVYEKAAIRKTAEYETVKNNRNKR